MNASDTQSCALASHWGMVTSSDTGTAPVRVRHCPQPSHLLAHSFLQQPRELGVFHFTDKETRHVEAPELL